MQSTRREDGKRVRREVEAPNVIWSVPSWVSPIIIPMHSAGKPVTLNTAMLCQRVVVRVPTLHECSARSARTSSLYNALNDGKSAFCVTSVVCLLTAPNMIPA